MKDWLEHSGIDRKELNMYEDSSYLLSISRNLCLRAKHYSVKNSSKPRIADFKIPMRKMNIARIYNNLERNYHYSVLVDGKDINVLDIADNCISDWKAFIVNNSLHKTYL